MAKPKAEYEIKTMKGNKRWITNIHRGEELIGQTYGSDRKESEALADQIVNASKHTNQAKEVTARLKALEDENAKLRKQLEGIEVTTTSKGTDDDVADEKESKEETQEETKTTKK